jgi:23S rRNA pseudouridine955/2504/2580 synthase
MSGGVQQFEIGPEESEQRLDRWFKRHFPGLTHIRLEKLLRTGQIRVGGGRVKAAHRLSVGDIVRVPPLQAEAEGITTTRPKPVPKPLTPHQVAELQALVIHRDAEVMAINKPHGLAVQGGTNTVQHLDGMLDALRFDGVERPRLVHRLDKDTSGVLLLARTAKAAQWLTRAFREKTAHKIYWALVAGVPRPHKGRIDLAIAKGQAGAREKVVPDEEDGRSAVTYYSVIEQAAQKAAWLALLPLTGRTHQLRVHCAEIGTPIVGDGKYGGEAALLPALEGNRKLHLHARSLTLSRPDGKRLTVTAPLPPHMQASWDFFEFASDTAGDPFAELDLD